MLQDPKLMAAVSRIIQRSERQEDIHKLVGTYVDVGLLPQLNNINHQIFYGRRGTGKTHMMKVVESMLRQEQRNTVVYIDCRTLGSTSQFSDPSIPIPRRCLSLFRDFLLCVYHALLEHVIEVPSKRAEEALKETDRRFQLVQVLHQEQRRQQLG
jgi:ABC-type Na+ transport system ATPase subunit NatA